jgi:hypothetical protein
MLGGIFSMYFQARSETDSSDGAFILAGGRCLTLAPNCVTEGLKEYQSGRFQSHIWAAILLTVFWLFRGN